MICIGIITLFLLCGVLFWPEDLDWWKKRKKNLVADEVKCSVCKHKIDNFDAQAILLTSGHYDAYNSYPKYNYYCPLHVVPYDEQRLDRNYSVHFFKTIRHEVNKDGQIL